MTPTGRVGRVGHRQAVNTAALAERREREWTLFLAGASMTQIAGQVGVSNATVCVDLWAVLAERKASYGENADRWRHLHLGRTEAVILAHWPMRDRPRSAEVIIRALARQARLLGLDAPVQVAPVEPDGAGGLRPYRSVSDAELDARIAELLRQVGAGPAIDVTPRGNGHGRLPPGGGPESDGNGGGAT